MAYEITGKVKILQEAETFASGFTKRCVVVTVEDGKYPQDINLEFVQDSVSKLDSVNEGDTVTVTFDIRGKEYNGRYFNNLVGWKISVDSAGQAPTSSPAEPAPLDNDPANIEDDDLPF